MGSYSISLITLTLNSDKDIRACVESVKAQTRKPDQYIIKDGGSNDETLSLISSIIDDVEIYQQKDNGIYSGLNQALEKVTCDLVMLLHSDDVLHDATVISNVVEHFNKTNCDVVFGDIEILQPETRRRLRYWRSSPFRKRRLIFGWMPAHTSLVMRKSIFEEVGGFDESYEISGDYDHILRVFSRDDLKFEYLPRVITSMQAGGTSNRNFTSFVLKWREDIKAARQLSYFPYLTVLFKRLRKVMQFFIRK